MTGSDHRGSIIALGLIGLALSAALAIAMTTPAVAQPFGLARPPPPESGIIGWLLAKQGEFFQQFSRLIRAAKADGSAIWTLTAVSFAYGVFHAAGPGHGKAVISSYLVANAETWRRGIVLSFASALLQALVAVAVVGIAAALFQTTARTMNITVWWIEITGYALIALMGARLTWVKGRSLVRALRRPTVGGHARVGHSDHHATAAPALAEAGAQHRRDHHAHADHHHGHAHGYHTHDGHNHGHHHGSDEPCDHCGHAHGPLPQDLVGPGGWQRGLTAIIAVGLRPCSGAILVLVFALAQGLFWVGVVSTLLMGLGTAITVAAIATVTVAAKGIAARRAAHKSGGGTLVLRAIETGAAILVLAFGAALLLGYMASERMIGL